METYKVKTKDGERTYCRPTTEWMEAQFDADRKQGIVPVLTEDGRGFELLRLSRCRATGNTVRIRGISVPEYVRKCA